MKFLEYIELNPKVALEKGKEYPFIEMSSVSTQYRNPEFIDIKEFDSGVKFQDGDTVVARITPCLQNGKRFYCKNIGCGFGSTEYLVFRSKDTNIVDNLYLYYFMNTEFIRKSMINSMTGATGRQRVNNDVFNNIDINFPKIKTQRRIADILSAYDDLIENNQKQIKLLEEAAQRLYKEWFVDLRFPGYEQTKIIDGVPEGWHIGCIDEILVYHDKKRKPLSSLERTLFKGEYRYYGAAGILDYVNGYLFDGTYLLLGEDGSVITIEGTPVLQYVTGKFWVNNHAHVLTGKGPFSTEYIYMMFNNMKISDVVTGVAQPKISQARLSAKKILIPCEKVVILYQSKVEYIFKHILLLERRIKIAEEARSRLLPKLMSGEIEV